MRPWPRHEMIRRPRPRPVPTCLVLARPLVPPGASSGRGG